MSDEMNRGRQHEFQCRNCLFYREVRGFSDFRSYCTVDPPYRETEDRRTKMDGSCERHPLYRIEMARLMAKAGKGGGE